MNEIAVLQRIAPNGPPMSENARLRARRRLLKRALEPTPAQRRRRRYKRIAAAGSVAAVALVVVVGALPFGHGNVGASPAAAEVLELSAETNLGQPVPGPGQYLYVRKVSRSWYYGPDSKAPGSPSGAKIEDRIRESWIPGDRSKPWISRFTATLVVGGKPFVEAWSSRDYGTKLYRDYPHDPGDLLAKLRGMGGSGDLTGDAAVWERGFDMLGDPTASPKFNAALLRALARLEGVKIVDTDVTVGNRTGVAISFAKHDPHSQLIIDPKTGLVIGGRRYAKHQESWTGPGNTTDISYTAEAKIVDSAPKVND